MLTCPLKEDSKNWTLRPSWSDNRLEKRPIVASHGSRKKRPAKRHNEKKNSEKYDRKMYIEKWSHSQSIGSDPKDSTK